jgi:hypothetical protein
MSAAQSHDGSDTASDAVNGGKPRGRPEGGALSPRMIHIWHCEGVWRWRIVFETDNMIC